MKSATSAQRPYQEVGAMIRDLIIKTPYNPGERLPPEREIAEMLDVTRTVVREALIMLAGLWLFLPKRKTPGNGITT